VAFLFDTDAISETLRPRPDPAYIAWLGTVARDDQFTSAVTVGELFYGAYRTAAGGRHVAMIEDRVLPAVTVLPFDAAVAQVYGRLAAALADQGTASPTPTCRSRPPPCTTTWSSSPATSGTSGASRAADPDATSAKPDPAAIGGMPSGARLAVAP
jgi:predicted nucleic acid-binding protein